jgi:hypothetical protein
MRLISIPLMVVSILGACTGDGAVGDSESLTRALASASAGDRVCLTAGVFDGSFEVPAGVTLCGAGVGVTRIIGPSDRPALRLAPGASSATVVTGVTVESSGDFGIVAVGAGAVDIHDAEVRVPSNGAGIGAESLTMLRLTSVNVEGPVTLANAGGMPLEPTISDSATYGVVAVSVMTVEATDMTVGGFAYVAILAVSSNLTLTNGSITSNLGTGLLVHGGSADLVSTRVDTALQGSRLIPAYNAVFAGNADITTNGLEVSMGEGYGILQSEATATHTDLLAIGNDNAALWIQNSGGFSLTGGTLRGNGMAGLVALESSDVLVAEVDIEDTSLMTRVIGTRPVMVGDGVHLLGSTTGITLDQVGLNENSRVGILVDLEGADFSGIDIRSVSVTGSTSAQLGAVAQDGTVPADWDANITRSPVIEANDDAFAGTLETVGIVGPSDLPAVTAVLASGIAGIVGPSD